MVRWKNPGLKGVPVIFANSFPKSGTHLLTQVMSGLTLVSPAVDSGLSAIQTFRGDSGKRRSNDEILDDLMRLLPGDTCYGHLHSSSEIVNLLSSTGYAAYFILRDPRDVVVSHVHYLTDMAGNHVHHAYYTQTLRTFDERLRTSITGRSDVDVEFGDINSRFQPYLGWLDKPEIMVLRFEDFMADRNAVLRRIMDHAIERGLPITMDLNKAAEMIETRLDPSRSPTFRRGEAGAWRESFNVDNTKLFKEIAGDLLVQLGYEQDLSW
jgi:hypothetical protein